MRVLHRVAMNPILLHMLCFSTILSFVVAQFPYGGFHFESFPSLVEESLVGIVPPVVEEKRWLPSRIVIHFESFPSLVVEESLVESFPSVVEEKRWLSSRNVGCPLETGFHFLILLGCEKSVHALSSS